MLQKLEGMIRHGKKAADAVLAHKGEIRVLSHYDADGIASAAILATALLRAGKRFHLTLVKQLTENTLASLAEEKRNFIVFLDMGAGHAELIRRQLADADVVIIDHHQQQGSIEGSRILQVNPLDFGIEDDISGSGVTYIVSRAMGPENRDLSGIAIVGAIGDSQIGSIGEEWGVFGLNREILKDAVETRKIRVTKGLRIWGRYTRPVHKALEYSVDPYIPNVSGSESSAVQFLQELGIQLKKGDGEWRALKDLSEEEQKKLASGIIAERVNGGHPNAEWIFGDVYELLDKGAECRDANEFATVLNACGKMGRGYLGVELCMNVAKAFLEVKWVLEKYRKSVGDAVRWIHEQVEGANAEVVRKTPNAWYVLAGSRVSEHIISNVISIVEKAMGIGKPVFAFADAEEGVKVSARAADRLVEGGLNLKNVVSKAADKAGGQGGGHSGAAGATIPAGSVQVFIEAAENALSPKEATNKSAGTEKNIKPGPQPNNSYREVSHGSAKEEDRQKDGGKKVEGQGLVQYLGS
jgi:single-stranded-DNA-specific exonuclease